MKNRWAIAMVALTLAGAAKAVAPQDRPPMSPDQAIARAATAMNGVDATFRLTVRNVGQAGKSIFLDSEEDYHDPASLNVNVQRPAQPALLALAGGDAKTLIGKTILVRGTARRVKIGVSTKSGPDGYYYQTQVIVTEPGQITLEP